VAEVNPRAFSINEGTGALMLSIRDPLGDGASMLTPADKEFIGMLCEQVQKATPLNPARVWTGTGQLVFGETTIALDTEHYQVDYQAMGRMESMRSVIRASSTASSP